MFLQCHRSHILTYLYTIFLRLAFPIQYKQFDMKDVPPMSNVSHINILVYHMSISETYDNDDTYYTVRVQSERRTENDLLCLWSR